MEKKKQVIIADIGDGYLEGFVKEGKTRTIRKIFSEDDPKQNVVNAASWFADQYGVKLSTWAFDLGVVAAEEKEGEPDAE